jgi:hypothetical protein
VCPLTVTGEDLDGLADAVDLGLVVRVIVRLDGVFARVAGNVGVKKRVAARRTDPSRRMFVTFSAMSIQRPLPKQVCEC